MKVTRSHRLWTSAWVLIALVRGADADEVKASQAPAGTQTFNIHEFRVLGNSTLKAPEIERAVYPFLGDSKSLADVEAARKALEELYHQKGYATVFVDIPPQDVVDETVRLRVIEGRLEKSGISGARYFSNRRILAALPEANVGNVPNIPVLQQELAAINGQTRDLAVVPVLKAGAAPGTMDLALKVQDQLPLHGSLEINNQHTAQTTALRTNLGLNYSNLFGERDNIGFQYQDSPQKWGEARVIAGNYTFRPVLGGLQASVSYIHSASDVPAIGTVGVLGKGQIISTRFTYPLQTTQSFSDLLTLGLDYKHFRDTINVDSSTSLQTPVSYVNGSFAYLANWRHESHQEVLSLAADFGPRGFANNSDTFANKRFQGRANYFYTRADLSLMHNLPLGFKGLLRVGGQYAAEPLISNENYSIAGSDGVRGYLEAEVLADTAIKSTLQLQSPQWGHWGSHKILDATLFADAGRATIVDPLPGEPHNTDLSSWGGGIDWMPEARITGNLLVVEALSRGIQTKAHEWRVLFTVRGWF